MGTRLRSLAGGPLVIVGLAVSFLGVVPGLDAVAGAAENPAPISDYAAYPESVDPAVFPATCAAAAGDSVLEDATFSVNGSVAVSDLATVPTPTPGQVVTMTWSGFAAGCEDAGVSLAFRRADTVVPDPTSNLELVTAAYEYCGPLSTPCPTGGDGRFVLSVVAPPRDLACDFQLDAVLGPPLADVGPAGSFYDAGLRNSVLGQVDPGRSTVIGTFTGGAADCGAPDPAATPIVSCSAGGVQLYLANNGELDATFTIAVGGIDIETIDVAPRTQNGPSEATRLIPIETADGVDIAVTSDGSELLSQHFQGCLEASATADITHACHAPNAIVVLDNPADANRVFSVVVDGVATEYDVTPHGLLRLTIGVPADGAITIVVLVGEDEIARRTVERDCEMPVATIITSCAENGAEVTITNGAPDPTTVELLIDGDLVAAVPVGGEDVTTAVLALEEDQRVKVTARSSGVTLADQFVRLDCQEPVVMGVTLDCSRGGYLVGLANEGESPTTFLLRKDGESAGAPVVVAASAGTDVLVPFGEDEVAELTVSGAGDVLLATELTRDCLPVSATFAVECVGGTRAVVTVTSTSDAFDTTVADISRDGTRLERVEVPGRSSVERSYELAEDETAAFAVTAIDGAEIGARELTADCVDVQGVQVRPNTQVKGTQLARTGSDAAPLTVVAGMLLAIGGILVALSGRKTAFVVSA